MNTCSNCKHNIPTYISIQRCFDLDFCSVVCRDKFLNIILIKDPEFKNPHYWHYYLNIEKDEDRVNYFNLYNKSNKINDTKIMNIKSFNFNDNNVKRKINPNNFVVNQTYINIDLPDFHKEKPERNCSNIYKLLFITTLTLLILINISFYIHISI